MLAAVLLPSCALLPPPLPPHQKADIWSCGVALYALVTNELPFRCAPAALRAVLARGQAWPGQHALHQTSSLHCQLPAHDACGTRGRASTASGRHAQGGTPVSGILCVCAPAAVWLGAR